MRLGRRENERGEEMRPAIRASRPKFIHTTAHYPLKRERETGRRHTRCPPANSRKTTRKILTQHCCWKLFKIKTGHSHMKLTEGRPVRSATLGCGPNTWLFNLGGGKASLIGLMNKCAVASPAAGQGLPWPCWPSMAKGGREMRPKVSRRRLPTRAT